MNLFDGGSIPLGHLETAVCPWEGRQPPKLSHGVRILAPLLLIANAARRNDKPEVELGPRSAGEHDGLRRTHHLQPCGCAGSHRSLRNCGTRFESSTRYFTIIVLGVCRIRTRLCEGRRPGSIPGEDARTTPMLDGRAAACKAVRQWVRFPPVSLADDCGFISSSKGDAPRFDSSVARRSARRGCDSEQTRVSRSP